MLILWTCYFRPNLIKTLVELLEAPGQNAEQNDDEDAIVEVEDLQVYDAAYVHLSAIGSDDFDPIPGKCIKEYVDYLFLLL